MDDNGYFVPLRAQHNGYGNKTALGKHKVRLEPLQQEARLFYALYHSEHIADILAGKITPQLPRRDTVIRYTRLLHQRFFNAVFRADIKHFPAFRPQLRQKRQIGGYMSGCAAPGQYDSFHKFHLWLDFCTVSYHNRKRLQLPDFLSFLFK